MRSVKPHSFPPYQSTRDHRREPNLGGERASERIPLGLLDGDRSRTAALVTLGSKDLVVVSSELKTRLPPGVEVVLDSDGAADALLLAHGPELVESRGAVDRGLVDALGAVDVVHAAVALDRAQLLRAAGRVVRPERLHDVVLDERVSRPPVHGQVAVDVGAVPRAVVRDDAGRAGVPSLAGYEVAHVGPRHVVRAARSVVVGHLAGAVGPEGIEEAVIGARAGGGRPGDEVERGGDGPGGSREGNEDG